MRWFGLSFAPKPSVTNGLHVSIARPPVFLLTLRFSSLVHHLSGPDKTKKKQHATHRNTHIHTYIHIHTHTHTYTYTYTHIHKYMYIYPYVHSCCCHESSKRQPQLDLRAQTILHQPAHWREHVHSEVIVRCQQRCLVADCQVVVLDGVCGDVAPHVDVHEAPFAEFCIHCVPCKPKKGLLGSVQR